MASSSGSSGPSGSSQSDTSLWLHNKLGTSNDSWTGGSIVSQLNPEILNKIQSCFTDLQPQVKLKLLLSLFHISKRNLEIWRAKLENILDVAKEDSEPWVCMLAELMKTYPSSGYLNSDITVPDSNRKIFNDLVLDLKKALKRSDQTDSVLPLECHFLNKNAFISAVGHMPQTQKHFTLKRKPKAAALKADLMHKSQDAANKVKSNSSGSFPMRKSTMPRKMTSDPGLKGLPSRTLAGSGFRSHRPNLPTRNLRKPEGGGVKLLDINEQPMGFAAARKRRRQQELEEQKKEKEAAAAAASSSTTGKATATAEESDKPDQPTPDYAAGLSNLNPATPAPAYAPPTPAYVPQPIAAPPPAAVVSTATHHLQPSQPSQQPPQLQPQVPTSQPPPPVSLPTTPLVPQSAFPAGLTTLEPLPQAAVKAVSSLPPPYNPTSLPRNPQPTQASSGGPRLVQLPTQPIPQAQTRYSTVPPASVLGAAIQQQQQQQQQAAAAAAVAAAQQQPSRIIQPANIRSVLSTLTPQPLPSVQTMQPQQPAQTPAAPVPQRKSLTLTREQALEAQEMFKTANKVTRPEKALILGFMAGSRDNPCPHLGNVVTIKLSENQENVLQNDQTYLTMIVETHFQMNYSTGEWRRIKKLRRLEEGQ